MSKLEVLLKWFDDNDIVWDKESLEVKQTNGSFGVYAKKMIKKDQTVVRIPKESILSIKTTGIANLLDEAQLEGGCPLALAVLYELAQKEQSPWFGYLQALPNQGEDLPIFWTQEEKDWFNGTEIEPSVQNDLNDLQEDYNDLIVPILDKHTYIFERGQDDAYSFDKFVKISTLISSRSFEVDAYHENALVPFADLFNHRGENEHVHFETEFDVCDICGMLEYCEHQYIDFLDEEDQDQADKEQGDNEEEEWEDEEDVDEQEEEELDTELPDLEELENAGVDFYDHQEDEEEKKDNCDMVTDRLVKKGEELFNTYGDHPNIALLSKYGFCYDDNKNDYISIGENSLMESCLKITMDNLKKTTDCTEDELEKIAIEKTKPRWEFYLTHEHILCPDENQSPIMDDYQDDDCQDACCSKDDHDHDHAHEEHEHEHDEDGGCCGEEEGKGRPYFINYEGLFEDKVMCLLYIMFVDDATFDTFVQDVSNALKYFEDLAKMSQKTTKKSPVNPSMTKLKLYVYQACLLLVENRRLDYLDSDEKWKPIKQELAERDESYENRRRYLALTIRIGEKKIIERSIKYYKDLVKEYSGTATNKRNVRKNKK